MDNEMCLEGVVWVRRIRSWRKKGRESVDGECNGLLKGLSVEQLGRVIETKGG